MANVTAQNGKLSVKAYRGDAKTLLAFNIDKNGATDLAGFTIQCAPRGQQPFYLLNNLQFKTPADHAQDPTLPPYSTINAPLHKFRWIHVPGSAHQGTRPVFGPYRYTVTPRYFVNKSMQPLDPSLSASVTIDVEPFATRKFALGFTRGFTQSQAFVRHFGLNALIKPKGAPLMFNTAQHSGSNASGVSFTYADEYEWLGFTAREKIFELLTDVVARKALRLDVFAYDFNEPDMAGLLLTLAKQGRVRIILDDAALHHFEPSKKKKPAPASATRKASTKKKGPTAEDVFEKLFANAAKGSAELKRGHFKRYAHDKVFIVSNAKGPVKVLTGSTNFSVTGLYVNSNHVIVFDDATVAAKYAEVFDEVWKDEVKPIPFRKSPLSAQTFSFGSKTIPAVDITFSPHEQPRSQALMDAIVKRIGQEAKKGKTVGSVLFAVMQIDKGVSPVYTALRALHANEDIFSYGISDSPGGIFLYRPQSTRGVLVTGKPVNTLLPPPFNQVPNLGGVGHQVHHKFVVCGFNGPDPTVYCGSSNLAVLGETDNGDNLLVIRDEDVATAFAIEAIGLVDHFDFLDRTARGPKKKPPKAEAVKTKAAVAAAWYLGTDAKWAAPYFDPADLHSVDRQLFA